MAKAATIPDGYYINWYGDSEVVYDNKRWSLVCFIKLCDALNIEYSSLDQGEQKGVKDS